MKFTRYDKEHLVGLSAHEVNLQIQNNLINDTESNTKSYVTIIISNVFTFFNFINEVDLQTTETPILPNLKKG